jgi:NADPH-dependent curcumin reductase CurA
MLPTRNRRWVLAERPHGRNVAETDFRLDTAPVAQLAEHEFLIQTLFLSVAPVMRQYMLDGAGIERPLQLGEVMRGRGVGRVIASRNADFRVGDIVHGKLGWQEFAVTDGSPYFMMYKVRQRVAPYSTALGALGLTGFTAYLGLADVGATRAGDRVLVSGAAGGVGSICAQIARNLGARRVVGLAGSAAKCALLTQRLGYDAAINYRRDDVDQRIAELLPDGIDVFFDNVGAEILDTGLKHIRRHARIVLCGQIATYVDAGKPRPLYNHDAIFKRMARMEAFFIYEMAQHFERAEAALAAWIAAGKLEYLEDRLEGLEQMPRALIRLYSGENIGKQVVHVSD